MKFGKWNEDKLMCDENGVKVLQKKFLNATVQYYYNNRFSRNLDIYIPINLHYEL